MAAYTQTTIRVCRVLLGLAVLWGFLGLAGIESWALDNETERATLRGLQGVQVAVEDVRPEAEQFGLTRQQLQTDVELQLRQAGIPVLTKEERFGIPGAPWLYINVNTFLRPEVGLSPSTGLAAYNIKVELRQLASLTTDGSLADVITWSVGFTGSVSNVRLADIRSDVRNYVDRFINAYLSVHPRPIGSATPASTSPRRNLVR
jgi:hypothetical protein